MDVDDIEVSYDTMWITENPDDMLGPSHSCWYYLVDPDLVHPKKVERKWKKGSNRMVIRNRSKKITLLWMILVTLVRMKMGMGNSDFFHPTTHFLCWLYTSFDVVGEDKDDDDVVYVVVLLDEESTPWKYNYWMGWKSTSSTAVPATIRIG